MTGSRIRAPGIAGGVSPLKDTVPASHVGRQLDTHRDHSCTVLSDVTELSRAGIGDGQRLPIETLLRGIARRTRIQIAQTKFEVALVIGR